MMIRNFSHIINASRDRVGLPISTYPGTALTGASVLDIVTHAEAQYEAQAALLTRYHSPCVLTAMDLSAEAEAFGCQVSLSPTEIPTVKERLITNLEQARTLVVPAPGDGRTKVYLEAAKLLRGLPGEPLVLGGCIGPFSLAARLAGVSEAMELTLTEPELMHILLGKCAAFLGNYIKAFRSAGAAGVIMAEPAAGLLSPRGVSGFSSAYIRRIAQETEDETFSIILHNCAARMLHLPAVLESGVKAFHFGAPMDIVAALESVPPEVVICGNLDPTSVFVQLPAEEVASRVSGLLEATVRFPNFVVSSGCDLPHSVPLANLDRFYQTLTEYNRRTGN